MGEQVRVAAFSDLPADTGKVIRIGEREIALFRVGDDVFVIDNECPHREGPLGYGDLVGDIVTCPFHAWEVNVRTGEVVDFPSLCSQTYRCRVEGDDIYVQI